MMSKLTSWEKAALNYCGRYIAKKSSGGSIFQPHKAIVALCLKVYLSPEKKKLMNAYISERFFSFSVGKHSKGYSQFWSVRNNGARLLESIGSFCSIAPNVMIAAGNHPLHYKSTHAFLYRKNDGFIAENKSIKNDVNNGSVRIGNDVWIGTNVTILPGVSISDGAVIAAGSIVNKDVPAYAIVGGVPAKIIKYRFSSNTIRFLLEEKWWRWSDQKIKSNVQYMYDESYWTL